MAIQVFTNEGVKEFDTAFEAGQWADGKYMLKDTDSGLITTEPADGKQYVAIPRAKAA